jgi:hypothetical protein
MVEVESLIWWILVFKLVNGKNMANFLELLTIKTTTHYNAIHLKNYNFKSYSNFKLQNSTVTAAGRVTPTQFL